MVDDSVPSAYFKARLDAHPGVVIPLNQLRQERVDLPGIGLWVDLESIDFLADGRLVMLSERLRSMIGAQGRIAEYYYPLSEIGRRGLEGLAVRPLGGGASRIAALWEGGYPDRFSMHPDLEAQLGGKPFRPLIFVHDLTPGETTDRIRWNSAVAWLTLNPPIPSGDEPHAQRFRAPDLVWYDWSGQSRAEPGFIVLLSSQNAVERPEFLHHWLQRFDDQGAPVGEALDLADYVPVAIGNANWEGLCWYEPGQSLIVVHEAGRGIEPNAFILELPADWRAASRRLRAGTSP